MTHVYTVSGVKTFRAMEGQGFNATLLRNGKRVATIINEGTGGATYAAWEDIRDPFVRGNYRTFDGKIQQRDMTPEESILNSVAVLQPAEKVEWCEELQPVTEESLLDEIVNHAICAKRLRSMLAKRLVFIHDGKPMSLGPLSDKLTVQVAAERVLAKYPDARVLNTLDFDTAVCYADEAGV